MEPITGAANRLSLRQAAQHYGLRGWPIFPLAQRGKHPLTKHGLHDASSNLRAIERWWARQPAANIGLACGTAGLVVVDVDPAHGGMEAWARIDPRVRTLTSRTGSDGFHYFYIAPVGVALRSSAGKLGPGLDVRAAGGYVVLPPSIHPNGRAYQWIDVCDIAPLPNGLLLMLTKRRRSRPEGKRASGTEAQAVLSEPAARPVYHEHAPALSRYAPSPLAQYVHRVLFAEVERVRTAQVGTRHDTLNRAAFVLGRLVGGHLLDSAAVKHYLTDAALACGLPIAEARRTIAGALAAGVRQPRTAPDDEAGDPTRV
jgi:hypothetical protein